MKKFFNEFKTFISRGNVMDMAVGVIIGGAFSAIVTALTNQILMPIINWVLSMIFGKDGMAGAVTILSPAYQSDAVTGEQVLDLSNSIYIDWGAFITAIINFILIALVLFLIIKFVNRSKELMEMSNSAFKKDNYANTKEGRAELKEAGVNYKDKEAGKAYFEAKKVKEAEEAAAKAEADKKAAEEAAANAPEALLKEIRDLLKNK